MSSVRILRRVNEVRVKLRPLNLNKERKGIPSRRVHADTQREQEVGKWEDVLYIGLYEGTTVQKGKKEDREY